MCVFIRVFFLRKISMMSVRLQFPESGERPSVDTISACSCQIKRRKAFHRPLLVAGLLGVATEYLYSAVCCSLESRACKKKVIIRTTQDSQGRARCRSSRNSSSGIRDGCICRQRRCSISGTLDRKWKVGPDDQPGSVPAVARRLRYGNFRSRRSALEGQHWSSYG